MSHLSITHDRLQQRQERAYQWAMDTYGVRTRLARYQAFRFLEEAMELAQTQGLNFDDVVRVARWVHERPMGDTKEEIGDTALCLLILSENLGLSFDSCLTSTLLSVRGNDPVKSRAKDDAKIKFGLI